jgi:Icc-related predicted phosphoesterase
MRILYVTDIHGVSYRYNKILELHKNFDLTIIGGDILPKYVAKGNIHKVQRSFITKFLPGYFKEFKTDLIIEFANDDHACNYQSFKHVILKFNHIHIHHLTETIVDDTSFIGMNFVPDHPFGLKDWCRRDDNIHIMCNQPQLGIPCISIKSGYIDIINLEKYYTERMSIRDVLKDLLPKPTKKKCIYLFHCPPRTLGLDVCLNKTEVGSNSITEFIIQNKPELVLCGHIHESPSVSGKFMGYFDPKSLVIQPGQHYLSDKLTYCTFDSNRVLETLEIIIV